MTLAWPKALIGAALLTAGLLFAAPTARGQTPPPETPTVTSTETPTPTPTPTPEGTSPPPPPPTSTPYRHADARRHLNSDRDGDRHADPYRHADADADRYACAGPDRGHGGRIRLCGPRQPAGLPKPARRREDRRQIPLRTPGGSPPPGAVPLTSVIDPSAGNPPPASVSSAFDGLGSVDNVVGVHPPDPQLAVGPSHVIEMVNISGRIFDRSGTALDTFLLTDFFLVPSGSLDTDPKVIYDPASGRFFAAYASFTDGPGPQNDVGRLHIAVSTTSNPLDEWKLYVLAIAGQFPDYPGLGVSDDKLTISYNLFQIGGSGFFQGVQTLVVEKSQVVAGATSVDAVASTPTTSLFTIRPAHSLTATNTQYMASVDNASSSVIRLFEVTGTPAGGDVVFTNIANPSIESFTSPPDAQQLGTGALIATNDNRVLETVWRDGHLWAAANAACTFPGDGTAYSCLKLIEVDTGTNIVLQDILYGSPGEYFLLPGDPDGQCRQPRHGLHSVVINALRRGARLRSVRRRPHGDDVRLAARQGWGTRQAPARAGGATTWARRWTRRTRQPSGLSASTPRTMASSAGGRSSARQA